MLKVCHILSGDLWAGAEVSAYHLLKGLRACPDLRCSAILLNEGMLADSIRRLDIPVHIFDESKMSFFQIFWGIKKVLKREAPNIVHSHRYKENMLACLVSKTNGGLNLITTQHGLSETAAGNRSVRDRVIMKLNFTNLTAHFHVVAVSRDVQKNLVRDYGIPAPAISVIHNGIEIPDIQKRPEKKEFVIGAAGRLFPVKDYSLMVHVAKEVVKKTGNIRFVVAGDGPELNKITGLIQEYGLNKFFVLKGFVTDIDSFYKEIDLYLNTSIHEGISMSALEAMARSIPVIAPGVGGFQEIIDDGVQGFLLRNRSPQAFAEKCLALYGNDVIRSKMGMAGRKKIAENLSVQHMVKQYRQAYLSQCSEQ